jgi:hypothetical protein
MYADDDDYGGYDDDDNNNNNNVWALQSMMNLVLCFTVSQTCR